MKSKNFSKSLYFVCTLFLSLLVAFSVFSFSNVNVAHGASNKPYLLSISEAIKPNEIVTIMGNNIKVDDNFKLAYAKNQGKKPDAFDEGNLPVGVKYLTATDLISKDSNNNTGVMFIFPATESAGEYDFWIKNSSGWSNGITMNCARPLNLTTDGAYAGTSVEIVGRNFAGYEFGVGSETNWQNSVKVKLVSVDNVDNAYVHDIQSGVRYAKADNSYDFTFDNATDQPATEAFRRAIKNRVSVTDKEVLESNPYKITFKVKDGVPKGEYKVFVANNGVDYRELEEEQTLTVYEKKAQSWDESLFGPLASNTHVGNDPLDLGVYWAQDYNYSVVKTMSPNTVNTADSLKASVLSAIIELANGDGGVVYFPEGDYYLPPIDMNADGNNATQNNWTDKIIFMGDGMDKTHLHYVGEGGNTWFYLCGDNIGYYGLSFDANAGSKNPDFVLSGWDKTAKDPSNTFDVANGHLKENKNYFVVNCSSDFGDNPLQPNRGMFIEVSVLQNMLCKDLFIEGGAWSVYSYTYKYMTIKNIFDRGGLMTVAIYSVFENVYQDNGHEIDQGSHGITGRSVYIGNCYQTRAGEAGRGTNDGETVLLEPSGSGYSCTGTVTSATARSFNMDWSGKDINEVTNWRYGYLTAYITDGTGIGQYRHIKRTHTGNKFELLDEESDWDVIPDSTSKITVICSLENATVYRLYGVENRATICLYSCMMNALVAECNLVDTGGISIWATNVNEERCAPSFNTRIENNTVIGRGSKGAQCETGGIQIQANGGAGYRGAIIMGVSIKNNYVASNDDPFIGITSKSYTPDSASNIPKYNENTTHAGRSAGIYFDTAIRGSDNTGNIRFVTVENNTVKDTNYGVYQNKCMSCLAIRGNDIIDAVYGDIVTGVVDGLYVSEGPSQQPVPVDNEYNIIYILYGGTNAISNTATYKQSTGLVLANPTKVDCTFEGWYLDSEFKNKITYIAPNTTGTITLYAKFVANTEEKTETEEDKDTNSKSQSGIVNCNGYIGGAEIFGFVSLITAVFVIRKKLKIK